MALRSGNDYLKGLDDGREVWLDGERVRNVADHPLLGGAARTIAELYDFQNEPDVIDRVSFVEGGERVPLSLMEPKTQEDLAVRREGLLARARLHGGMLGRAPDFMNVMMTDVASDAEFFGQAGSQFADNARGYHAHLKRNDLALTHTLLHPQRDRSTSVPTDDDEENAARIVGETDSGFIIRGARMLATLAPFSDEIAIMPSSSRYLPDSEEAKQFAFSCSIPANTPGLRLICRTSLTQAGPAADHPLSSRFDEQDCVVVFDDVVVPWERTFIYREPSLTVRSGRTSHASMQTAIKDLAKTEFMLGIAYQLAEATNILQFPNVLNTLAEMGIVADMVRGAIFGAEAASVPGPGGTIGPDAQILSAQRQYYLEAFPKLQAAIQSLGAGGLMMTPSTRELQGELREDIAKYFQAANLPADKRIALYALARDVSSSGFAGRQALYERFFAGDPWRIRTMMGQRNPRQDIYKANVDGFLGRIDNDFGPALEPSALSRIGG